MTKFDKNFEVVNKKKGKLISYPARIAFSELGFTSEGAFLSYLKENDFIDWEGMPAGFFLTREFITYKIDVTCEKKKYISNHMPPFDSKEYFGNVYGYLITPLFTQRGIEFLKRLQKDCALTKKIKELIKLEEEQINLEEE